MSCFPCCPGKKSEDNSNNVDIPVARVRDNIPPPQVAPVTVKPDPPVEATNKTEAVKYNNEATNDRAETANNEAEADTEENGNSSAKPFTFRELATATKNFRQECLLGESGFGRVFKGTLQSSGQVVAVRQLDRSAARGKEFQVEALALCRLNHPNLVSLIGYCTDGDQRLLVYEYLPSGSLEQHLFDVSFSKKPLNWSQRMKIASGVAQGLEYLHEKANPPIIYPDLKSTDILLDEQHNPRLSGYGLAKIVPSGNTMHASPSVMAANGYCAPEYERQGELTSKSDVYNFGVVLLELITGRRALDHELPGGQQHLVTWAQPFFRDPKKFPEMADPLLRREFPETSLSQAVGAAAMCLQEEPSVRPLISDVVAALTFLAMAPPNAAVPARLASILSSRVDSISQPVDDHLRKNEGRKNDENDSKSSSDFDSSGSSVSSDQEGEEREDDEAEPKIEDSKKLGSSSKHKSKAESQQTVSHSSSRRSYSDSDSSQDDRFSMRHEDSFEERSVSANSRHENIWKSHDYSDHSSSDDGSHDNSRGASSRHGSKHLSVHINSSNSNADLHTVSRS